MQIVKEILVSEPWGCYTFINHGILSGRTHHGGEEEPDSSALTETIPEPQEPGMWHSKARSQIQTPAWPPWSVWKILQCHSCVYVDFPHIFLTSECCPSGRSNGRWQRVPSSLLRNTKWQRSLSLTPTCWNEINLQNHPMIKTKSAFLQWCITSFSYLQGSHNKQT